VFRTEPLPSTIFVYLYAKYSFLVAHRSLLGVNCWIGETFASLITALFDRMLLLASYFLWCCVRQCITRPILVIVIHTMKQSCQSSSPQCAMHNNAQCVYASCVVSQIAQLQQTLLRCILLCGISGINSRAWWSSSDKGARIESFRSILHVYCTHTKKGN